MSIHYSKEVAAAIAAGSPIVALESTIISHGLPRPSNLTVAQEVEEIVRAHGATPATIAILDGVVHVGLEADQLVEIANRDDISKASIRDLAMISALKTSAATTVAELLILQVLLGSKSLQPVVWVEYIVALMSHLMNQLILAHSES